MDNPDGKVPVLLDGDVRVPDSGAICEYLDEKYPNGGSLGEAAIAGVGQKLFPSFVQFLKSRPEEQAEKEPALLEQLQQLNDYIEENGPYLCGDEMGAADTMMVRCTSLSVVSRYPYLESTQTGTIGHHTPSNSISCKCTSMHYQSDDTTAPPPQSFFACSSMHFRVYIVMASSLVGTCSCLQL